MKPPTAITPPTPEQFADHLDRHPPRAPSPMVLWGPMAGLGALLVGVMLIGGWAALVLPWLAVAALFGALAVRAHRLRSLERRATRAQELAMLRRYPEALRRGWVLLPQAAARPSLYVRLVALIAQCLDHLHAYDAAITGYDHLLEHLPAEHPGAVQLRVQRALAALGAERLADADDTLRGLRGVIGAYNRTPIGAGYRLAELTQHVRTHHYTDALALADDLLDDLRPLGVEAGYGHALLALCFREDRSERAPDDRARDTAVWWRRATLLLPEAALVERYPELRPLAEQTPRPLGE